jgi:hypothetical protein
MKAQSSIWLKVFLLIFLFTLRIQAFDSTPIKIRGRIIARVLTSQLLVRTSKKEYVLLNLPNFSTNPLPENVFQKKRVWTFVVRPASECRTSFSFFRFQPLMVECGNEYPLDTSETKNTQPVTPILLNPYPQLIFTDSKYQKELDTISDEIVPRCFDLDLEKTKPSYRERLITGTVIYSNDQPAKEVEVSVGFANSNTESYIALTDENGRFAFLTYDNFAYWVKLRHYSINKEKTAIQIPPKTRIEPLHLSIQGVAN